MEVLKFGDVVQLRSGGQVMTVTDVRAGDSGPRVECSWFEESHSGGEFLVREYFLVAALRKIAACQTGPNSAAVLSGREAQRQEAANAPSWPL